jgi:hypothetical protein
MPRESERWYYQFVVDLMRAHLKKFPDRKILFRPRPGVLGGHGLIRRLMTRPETRKFIKSIFRGNENEVYYLNGQGFIEKFNRLMTYLRKALPENSFELDTHASFREAVSCVDYVIGNYTTCFLETMYARKPFYCYNPAGIDYPTPYDSSAKYVFSDAERLVGSIGTISFDDVYAQYATLDGVEAIWKDYESAMHALKPEKKASEDISLT